MEILYTPIYTLLITNLDRFYAYSSSLKIPNHSRLERSHPSILLIRLLLCFVRQICSLKFIKFLKDFSYQLNYSHALLLIYQIIFISQPFSSIFVFEQMGKLTSLSTSPFLSKIHIIYRLKQICNI